MLLLSEFTGTGGGPLDSLIRHALSMFFWLTMIVIARTTRGFRTETHDRVLALGFAIAAGRDLFMMVIRSIEALDGVAHETIHVFFPPFEHALSMVALAILVGGAIMYLTANYSLSINYIRAGVAVAIGGYLATFLWWGGYVLANPMSTFGQTWGAWVFHIANSSMLLFGVIFIWRNSLLEIKKPVCLAVFLFFLSEFLKIPDIATGERYEHIFTPFRHLFYLMAIPAIAYAYLKQQSVLLQIAFNRLRERTAEFRKTIAEMEKAHPTPDHDVTIPNVDGDLRVGEVREFVNKIVDSDTFLTSSRPAAILKYVVDKKISGEEDLIKGYTIGVDALNLGSSFNPDENPIVRVTAHRLRALLHAYYEREGADDAMVINIPKGRYVPEFERRARRAA